MAVPKLEKLVRREIGKNVWLGVKDENLFSRFTPHNLEYEVLEDEHAVGEAMFEELQSVANSKTGDIVFVLLGGRGAQALHKKLGALAKTNETDDLLSRLHVFTQDSLAPMRMNNSFSFVRDFERLLGEDFFNKIKSFTPMRTESEDLEADMIEYAEKIEGLGGIDIFFIGLGPEAEANSHLCYIKPFSGASINDYVGVIPISESILDHHISKFKAGGAPTSDADETECRNAKFILTLAPLAILTAKRVVQSIVDASTAPAKVASFKKLLETKLSEDKGELAKQIDENPGLLIRLHPNYRTLILPDVLQSTDNR
jgi:6-phosphogluconolactonase/glucosamine-6-phosphate isomerase/deaminase